MPWSVFFICSGVEELKGKRNLWVWVLGFTGLQVFVQNAERLFPVPHVKLGNMSYFKWLPCRHAVYQEQSLYMQLEEIWLSSGSVTNSLTCELLVIILWQRRGIVLNADFYTYPCSQKKRRVFALAHLSGVIFPSFSHPEVLCALVCWIASCLTGCIVNSRARVGLGVEDHFSWQ